MVATIKIDVVSAEEAIYSGMAEFVVLPGELGELGVYPHHTPLLARLKAGAVRIQQTGQEETLIFVSGGMLEIQPNGITVLADTAIRGADLDEAKALAAKKAAEEVLSNKSGNIDHASAHAELASSIAQLAALAKIRKITH